MPRKHSVGQEVNGYRITEVFDPGAMALAYAAEASDGSRIFLKQYKSPSIAVPWYDAYKTYQGEINHRINASAAASFCVRPLQSFEASAPRSFWVAYEFVEGHDLEGLLSPAEVAGREHARDTWENRVVWAKLLMKAVAELHAAGVVHTDLKPKNVHLIADPSIGVGYQLKLIDMDFSVLTDRRAPWLPKSYGRTPADEPGTMGYMGSPGYRSPEHLCWGLHPGPASDVFTCGLMLYELLGTSGSPYPLDDGPEYQNQVTAYTAALPRFRGRFTSPAADSDFIAAVIQRCLSPNPATRPTADQVKRALNGKLDPAELRIIHATPLDATLAPAARTRTPGTHIAHAAPTAAVAHAAPAAAKRAATPRGVTSIRLIDSTGQTITIGVRTELSKQMLRRFGSDAEYWSSPQCTIERDAAGVWRVTPNIAAKNGTMLNGKALSAPQPLAFGDVLSVGNAATGVTKLPLTVAAAG